VIPAEYLYYDDSELLMSASEIRLGAPLEAFFADKDLAATAAAPTTRR
jgi:hypothetical protein